MEKNCRTCKKLYCKASHPPKKDNNPNNETTNFDCYCTEKRKEFEQLGEKDDHNFFCPSYELK
jgi:hypothetical protein